MTTRHLKSYVLCVLAMAASTAGAMPVGVRLAMQGHAIAKAADSGSAFPELGGTATPESVAAALVGVTDGTLADNIKDSVSYSEFRTWATSVGAATVKASSTAWMSYALDLAAIMPTPQDGDLVIDDVSIDSDGTLEAVFSLKDVNIGSAALEARLKTVFGVEGATTLDESAFSSDNVGLSLEPTGDGRVRATVIPPEGAGNAYFMRMKIK